MKHKNISTLHIYILSAIFLFTPALLIVGFYAYLLVTQPAVIIAPHHNIPEVALIKTQLFQHAAKLRPQTKSIILVSTDHFNPNPRHLSTSTQNWQTKNGQINYDHQLGSKLSPYLNNIPELVSRDHGIYNLLSDISLSFPKVKIVPILVGDQVKFSRLDPIIKELRSSCHQSCLLVLSVDFSHYLPAALADTHDLYSLKVLSNQEINKVNTLEIDSQQAIYIGMNHAKNKKTLSFKLYSHTNSGRLINNYDIETTSHIMGWYQYGKINPISPQTFVYATNLIEDSSQQTVGQRFFYGTDITDSTLSITTSPFTSLTIKPATTTAIITSPSDHLDINLGNDTVIAGSVIDQDWQLTILPLAGSNYQYLAIEEIKAIALSQIFPNQTGSLIFNSSQGTISTPGFDAKISSIWNTHKIYP